MTVEEQLDRLEDRPEMESIEEIDGALQWMLDAPFFIDAPQLQSFSDAVFQPSAHRDESLTLELTEHTARTLSAGLDVEVNPLKLFGSLSKILSPVQATAAFAAERSNEQRRDTSRSITFTPIETPQRELIQLTAQYLANNPDRIFFVDNVRQQREWEDHIDATPRALAFLDLPAKREARSRGIPPTKIIPMAVEFSDGRIETLYDKLGSTRKNESWAQYIDNFSPEIAIRAIEEMTAGRGSIQWINYRIPLDSSRTARIHFQPDGEYSNGSFAYNLIHKGYNNGIRLIGTVYNGPDLRVLAGYRK